MFDNITLTDSSNLDINNSFEEPENSDLSKYEAIGYVTGDTGQIQDYIVKTPVDIEIIIDSSLFDEIDPDTQKNIDIFISSFRNILIKNRNIISHSITLPSLMVKPLDDKSVLIEWIFKDFRIGFSIEPIIEESSWYLVSNKNLNEFNASGLFKIDNLNSLFRELINFVLLNS